MHRLLAPLLPALALLLAQCRRPDPAPTPSPVQRLPLATQSGLGTFGCLANGKVYRDAYVDGHGSSQSGTTIFLGMDGREEGTGEVLALGLYLSGKLESGQSFRLTPSPQPIDRAANQVRAHAAPFGAPCYYSGDYVVQGGRVTLTKYDGVRRIIAGGFALTLYEPGGCDTLRLTDGRFDLKF